MADHHIDTKKDFNYSAAAETILKKMGLFIVDAPPINHKPGNDLWSDVYYPLPDKDDRWSNPSNDNNQIKNNNTCDCNDNCCCNQNITKQDDLFDYYEMDDNSLHQLQSIQNPVITYKSDIGKTLFSDVVYKYTGLSLQANEKKTFLISFLKPKYHNMSKDRQVELLSREVTTGHLISISTFDGWKYHIFRGMVIDILKVEEANIGIRSENTTSGPYGTRIQQTTKRCTFPNMSESRGFTKPNTNNMAADLIKRNIRIVLDVSEPFNSKIESIPVNQIIDIEDYNFIYNFSIYEGRLNLLWKDWYQEKDSKEVWTTYVPFGSKDPQNLYHPVIEHQRPHIIPENPERDDANLDDVNIPETMIVESQSGRLMALDEDDDISYKDYILDFIYDCQKNYSKNISSIIVMANAELMTMILKSVNYETDVQDDVIRLIIDNKLFIFITIDSEPDIIINYV